MKTSRVILYGFLVFPLIGAELRAAQQKCTVVIDNCTVKVTQSTCKIDGTDLKTPLVDIDDQVTWISADPNYSVTFSRWHSPFDTNTPQVGTAYPVTWSIVCNTVGSAWPSLCYYQYDLTKGTSTTPCTDPGVRVVTPPGIVSTFYSLVAIGALISVVYGLFRIRARNRASA